MADTTLDYDFLLATGSIIGLATRLGPDLTYTGNGGTSLIFDENGTLVSTTNDESRYDHDPVTGAPLGILNEGSRENQLFRSQEFDQAYWGKTRSSITADQEVAPDGTTTMDQLIEDSTSSATHLITRNNIVAGGMTITDDTVYTVSIFAKDVDRGWLRLEIQRKNSTFIGAYFDIATGVLGTVDSGVTAIITAVGNDTYRCSVSMDFSNGANDPDISIMMADSDGGKTYTGLGTKSFHVWGAQIEEGSSPTSHIPTTTVAVTRTADVLTTTDVTWFNATAGTFVVHGNLPNSTGLAGFMTQIDDGSNSNRITMRLLGNDTFRFATDHASDTDGNSISAGAVTPGTLFKCAGAYADDDVRGCLDGVLSPADASAAHPLAAAMTTFRLNTDATGGDEFNGHIAQITYWNVRKPDTFLVAVTTENLPGKLAGSGGLAGPGGLVNPGGLA